MQSGRGRVSSLDGKLAFEAEYKIQDGRGTLWADHQLLEEAYGEKSLRLEIPGTAEPLRIAVTSNNMDGSASFAVV